MTQPCDSSVGPGVDISSVPVYRCVPGPELNTGGAPLAHAKECRTATERQQLPLPKTGHI